MKSKMKTRLIPINNRTLPAFKLGSLILILTLIFTGLFNISATTNQVFAEDDEGIVMSIALASSNSVSTGREVPITFSFNANLGRNTNYDKPYILFTADDKNKDLCEFNLSGATDLENDYSIVKAEGEMRLYPKDYDVAVILKDRILAFNHKKLLTPHNTTSTISMKLMNGDGTVIKDGGSVNVTGTLLAPKHRHEVLNTEIGEENQDKLSTDLNKLEYVKFNYKLGSEFVSVDEVFNSSSVNDNIGRRAFSEAIITQPMPEYAHFDANKNPGWILSGNNLEYRFNNERTTEETIEMKYEGVPLYLKFPGAPLNQVQTAASRVVYNPYRLREGEQPVVTDAEVKYTFGPALKLQDNLFEKSFSSILEKDTGNKVYPTDDRYKDDFAYEIKLGNRNKSPMTVKNIIDYDLDSRLYYKGLEIQEENDLFGRIAPSQATVFGIDEEGNRILLGKTSAPSFFNHQSKIIFSDKNQMFKIKKLEIHLPDGFVIPNSKNIVLNVITSFRDKDKDYKVLPDERQNIFRNSASYEGYYNDETHNIKKDVKNVSFSLIETKAKYSFKIFLSDEVSLAQGGWLGTPAKTRTNRWRAAGDYAIWNVGTNYLESVVKGLGNNDVVKNLKLLVSIPEGTTFDAEATQKLSKVRGASFKYKENYNNTGLNIVEISIPNMTAQRLNNMIDAWDSIRIVTKVSSEVWPKNYANLYATIDDQLLLYEDNRFNDKVVDELDIDADGNTTEVVAKQTAYFEGQTGKYLSSKVYIGDKHKNNFNPSGLRLEAGREYRYLLKNYNSTSSENNYKIYANLSEIGDKTLAKNAQSNLNEPRNSEFSNTLTGPIELSNDNFKVLYTTEVLTPENFATASFSDSISDYSEVRGFKVELKEGKIYRKDTGLNTYVPMKAQEGVEVGKKAYFDFIITKDDQSYVQTNVVYNEIRGPEGTLKITKKDKENQVPMQGVKFGIFANTNTSDQPDYVGVTGKTGELEFSLAPGEYQIKELSTLKGYVLPSDSDTASVEADQTTNKVITNERIKGQIKIIKVDSLDNTKKLKGAKFKISSGCRENWWTGEITCSYQDIKETDANGELIFDNLPIGKYQVEEVSAPEHYKKGDFNKSYTISSNEPIVETVENEHDKVSLTFKKIDRATNKPIHGIFFNLKQNDKYVAIASMSGESSNADYHDPEAYEKDPKAGVVTFEGLNPGKYTLVELESWEYVPIEPREIEIYEDTDLGNIYNDLANGEIAVSKSDKDTKEPLAGVTFSLLAKGSSDNPKKKKTDKDGKLVFDKLQPDTYILTEVKPLEGYKNSESQEIVITGSDEKINKEIVNEKKKGRVHFVKVDADDANLKLEGVEFALRQNGETKYTAISDNQGNVVFENVAYGIYNLVETKAKEGYQALANSVDPINIDSDGKDVDLGSISNTINKASVKLEKVDADNANIKLEGVTFALQQNGVSKYEAVTNSDGIALFSGVRYGDYDLKEMQTLDDYQLTSESKKVSVQEHNKTVDLGQITNAKKKGRVHFVKVDAEDANLKLEGVKFALQQNGETKYEATSDSQGNVVFENVAYGSYKLKEIATQSAYLLATEEREVKLASQEIDLGLYKNHKQPQVTPEDKEQTPPVNICCVNTHPTDSPVKHHLPKTGAESNYQLISQIFLISAILLLLAYAWFAAIKPDQSKS